MKVQIFEQLAGGHYTEYIKHLLPTLIKLSDEKLIDEIVVTITPKHFESESFKHQLSSYSPRVHFDPCLQDVDSRLSLDPKLMLKKPSAFASALKRRSQIATNLITSVQHIQPDYLISTTAETQSSLTLSLQSFLGRQVLPANIRSQGIFHYGCGGDSPSLVDTMKDLFYRSMWKYSPWSHLLFVNPLIYEQQKFRGNTLTKRFDLVPDPIASFIAFDKKKARNLLKIPDEGRYIGFIGGIDARVAIPELVKAFNSATSNPTDRLLLAGKILPRYKKLIEEEFKELVAQGRLIFLDRYLDSDEMNLGFCALDAVSLLYYRRSNLSANLLKAVTAQRPVIANDFGYTGMMVKRFGIGWSCDVLDHEALVTTIKNSLEQCEAYSVNEKTTRLIQFHHPDNYAATVLQDLHDIVMPGRNNRPKTWEWVLDCTE